MNVVERSLQSLWNPCSQMKDYERLKPLVITRAKDSYLHLDNGEQIIDAISSWWCKSLGHNHPRLKQALFAQAEQFEHVIFANTTNETVVKLAEKLIGLTKTLNKVFYAGDGSCAVEIALKMSLHSRKIRGQPQRDKFLSLNNSYHGETAGALSVSDVGLYRDPYKSMLFPVFFISPVYVSGRMDPLWNDIGELWLPIEEKLNGVADSLSAIIVEPIVQGAAGMKIYSPDFLKRLRAWTLAHDVHLIADEIMTGIGRTGAWLACEHASIEPDILCLGKGLTSGWLPFSAVLLGQDLYDLFYDDYETGNNFLHSHTYSGHVLGASVALATLEVIEEENICQAAMAMEPILRNNMREIAANTGMLTNVRCVGAIAAADILTNPYQPRAGFEVFQHALRRGALLRPLGNTLYWLPPLNTSMETLSSLKEITQMSLMDFILP